MPLTRKTPLKRSGKLGPGKKTKEWDRVRAGLKVKFQRAGITECEAKFPGCWCDNALGFAHTLKRRNITTPSLLEEVAILCNACHDVCEKWPEIRMTEFIRGLISQRRIPVA